MNERSALITLCGKEYEMILTTKAMKDINSRYGGLGKLGDRLSQSENFEKVIDELVWLLTLLINQGIAVENFKRRTRGEKFIPIFKPEEIEILTSPADFAGYKDAIFEALKKGTERHVKSEENPKNVTVG